VAFPASELTLSQAILTLQQQGLPRVDAQLLLLHVLGRTADQRSWLLAHDAERLTAPQQRSLWSLAQRIAQGEPMAYLTGRQAFYGLDFNVSPDVLVPRPDTETLVDWTLSVMADAQPCHVLDLGTGSGAVALALKSKRRVAQLWATDLSAGALQVAQANARRLGLELHWYQGDWLQALPADAPLFFCIVSNPPYIAELDPHLPALRHEPIVALTSGPDGLRALRHIITTAPEHLLPGGWLLLEHGFDQASAVRHLLIQRGFTQVQSRLDLAGNERCSGGQWPIDCDLMTAV